MRWAYYAVFIVCQVAWARAPSAKLGRTAVKGLGYSSGSVDLEFYGGLPFAEPPVGDLRFEPPVSKTAIDASTFDASKSGAACLQLPSVDGQSESCLTLNIVRPANIPSGKLLPVMMWVYGGGFTQGSSQSVNGTKIVTHSVNRGTPVIYVTANYRLGPLGYPQGEEAQQRGILNLALKDIIATLEWVQHNIGVFGGDKTKVTVFGMSAGSINLAVLYLNPDSSMLFRGVIFESGFAATIYAYGASHRQVDWDNYVAAVPECARMPRGDTVDCLKNANATVLLQAAVNSSASAPEEFPWLPTIDGPGGLYPDLPSVLFERGEFAHVPFIAGDVKDEGTGFTPTTFNSSTLMHEWIIANITPSSFPMHTLDGIADKLMELYPDVPALGCPFDTGNNTFGLSSQYKREAALLTDSQFHSQRRALNEAATRWGVKNFAYIFSDPQPQLPAELGVTHACDLSYIFDSTPPGPSTDLANDMLDYWISFAVSQTPNDGHGNKKRTSWPSYDLAKPEIIQLLGGNTTAIPDTYRQKQISYINSVPEPLRHKRLVSSVLR